MSHVFLQSTFLPTAGTEPWSSHFHICFLRSSSTRRLQSSSTSSMRDCFLRLALVGLGSPSCSLSDPVISHLVFPVHLSVSLLMDFSWCTAPFKSRALLIHFFSERKDIQSGSLKSQQPHHLQSLFRFRRLSKLNHLRPLR